MGCRQGLPTYRTSPATARGFLLAPAQPAEPMATTQEQLDEAIAARHAWRTGQTRSSVSFGDRTIQYSVDGLKQIDAYIAELRRTLAGTTRVRNRVSYAVPD